MRTVTAVLWLVCVGLVLVWPGATHGQQQPLAALQTELIASWVVTVEGEPRTRTLRISATSPRSADTLQLDAVYGWTDGNQTAVSAIVVQSGQEVRLQLRTQPGSRVDAVQASGGLFEGTFTTAGGTVKPVKLERASNEGIKERIAAYQTKLASAIVEPGPDVPKACAVFSGRWTGHWPNFGRAWLWIFEVGADCVAKCAARMDPALPGSPESCDIKDGVLVHRLKDAAVSYEYRGGELWARVVSQAGQNNAVFRKLKPGED